MSDYKIRMVNEASELKLKIEKLESFLWGEDFEKLNATHKTLLIEQLAHMKAYSNVLYMRIIMS